MIESTCGECGGKVLLPDQLPRTQEEKVAFRKAWDARVSEGADR